MGERAADSSQLSTGDGDLRVAMLDCGTLENVSLTVRAGECVCLTGASGSGKTRLLRAMADLDPHNGKLWLGGTNCLDLAPALWRGRVMLVPSESDWWGVSVGEHFPGSVLAAADLQALGFDEDVAGWSVSRLSSGERQRLSLLRAVARRPHILLLDEPTANLDADSIDRVETWLAHQRRRGGIGMLWVSHDTAQVARVADRHLRIRGARLESAPCR